MQATIKSAQFFLCMFVYKMFRFDRKFLMFAVISKFFQGQRHFVHVCGLKNWGPAPDQWSNFIALPARVKCSHVQWNLLCGNINQTMNTFWEILTTLVNLMCQKIKESQIGL